MIALFDYIARRPMLAAVLSAAALLDASNCVRLGHVDWFIPAGVALVLACLVKAAE